MERDTAVTPIPLRLGQLSLPGYTLRRSGVRWLCEDGHLCRPGEVIAFCNISLAPQGRAANAVDPFGAEARDVQIALAPRIGGRIRRAAESSRGGFLDQLPLYLIWEPDFIIGHVEPTGVSRTDDGSPEEVRLLFLAGRRVTELAEDRTGLLSGWHDRSRAWWGDRDGRFGTVLSLGNCEQIGIVRGERQAFLELLEAASGPAHAAFISDDAMLPSNAVVREQFQRTPMQVEAMKEDFARSFASGSTIPTPAEWIFGGLLLSALGRSPLSERYEILTRAGLQRTGPADAVILSLGSEFVTLLRHRRLGYSVALHAFRLAEAGPAVRAWIRRDFEPVKRTPDDIRRDYRNLFDAVRATQGTQFLIINVLSTLIDENIPSYAPFDPPLRDTLASVRAKELNLMLHDLAHERDVAIVDLDAIAAELGSRLHVPDSVHHSGILQIELRGEILRILRARGVPGFGGPVS